MNFCLSFTRYESVMVKHNTVAEVISLSLVQSIEIVRHNLTVFLLDGRVFYVKGQIKIIYAP